MDDDKRLWSDVYRDRLGAGDSGTVAKQAADVAVKHFRESFPAPVHTGRPSIIPPLIDAGAVGRIAIPIDPGEPFIPMTTFDDISKLFGDSGRLYCTIDVASFLKKDK